MSEPTERAVVLPELQGGLIDNLLQYIGRIDAAPRFTNAYEAIMYFELQKSIPDIQPKLDSLVPEQATLGSPSFILTCNGRRFDQASQIIWNGSAEPTIFVSDKKVTTQVNMATAEVAIDIPVQVQNQYGELSNTLIFKLLPA